MLSFISGIFNGWMQSESYKSQARLARIKGESAERNAQRQADAIMKNAGYNWELESERRQTMRQQQTMAVGAARERRSSSGFTSQGSGGKLEDITRRSFDDTIANAAKSAAIQYNVEWQTAESTKHQGKLARHAYEAEAEQLKAISKQIKMSTIISGIAGLASGVYGYSSGCKDAQAFNEKNAAAISAGKMEALDPYSVGMLRGSVYSGDVFNNFMGMNMYTASMTRKQSWGSFYSILTGAAPGYQHSQYSL